MVPLEPGVSLGPWPQATSWCPAGSKSKGTDHSEDMARAEPENQRPWLTVYGPLTRSLTQGHFHKPRAEPKNHRCLAHPSPLPFLSPFLKSLELNSLQCLMLPVGYLTGTFRTTASMVTGPFSEAEKSSAWGLATMRPWMVRNSPLLPELQTSQWAENVSLTLWRGRH